MTTPPAMMVLDNEAVQALADVHHRKHRRALSFIEVANQRSGRRRGPVAIVVPVAVRVETGWDRTAPSAATLNRISRARDIVLEARAADRAAQLRQNPGVSVVDATVAQGAEASARPVAILTSDSKDMHRLATLIEGDIRLVHL
ncbi:MAG: hypothetical protein M3N98_03740 [Actinomycetota bacterium]|nr:hypothetical protein [Actinomycetota bacterium]